MNTVSLRISAPHMAQLLAHTHRGDGLEHLAFAVVGISDTDCKTELLVNDVWCVPDTDLVGGAQAEYLEIKPEALLQLVNRACRAGVGLVEAHNHEPTGRPVQFSRSDVRGFGDVVPYMHQSLPVRRYGALVMAGASELDGLAWLGDPNQPEPIDEVCVVGPSGHRVLTTGSRMPVARPPALGQDELEQFDRQVRAFGHQGQCALRELSVGIVGLGGIGSIVANYLARLGIGRFVLVDPDRVEKTNLNRLDGACSADAEDRAFKVDVAKRTIAMAHAGAMVRTFPVSAYAAEAMEALSGVDLLVVGTDDSASRFAVNQVALAYLRPMLDIATGINTEDGRMQVVGGRYTFAFPGSGCLLCAGAIDPREASAEMQPPAVDEVHRREGYIRGAVEPAPAVMPLNGLVACSAVFEVLSWAAGIRPPVPQQYFDCLAATSSIVRFGRDEGCRNCRDLLGMGDDAALEARYQLWAGSHTPPPALRRAQWRGWVNETRSWWRRWRNQNI